MESVHTLDSTTFGGRRFTRKQLKQVQQTVETFKNLSRWELAQTICEHLDWKTANGTNKSSSGLALLEALEARGIITLPEKRHSRNPAQRLIESANVETPVECPLDELGVISLELATTKEDRALWARYVQTHHYLGHKRPVGAHLLYFVVSDRLQQRLGCISFSAATVRRLPARDKWIGWEKKHREKLLPFVLTQTRFLLLPWVDVPNLGSKVLSLASQQVGDDWVHHHSYRPVLLETFVDTNKFSGASYRAANWQYLGETNGQGRHADRPSSKPPKSIFAYPLQPDWRAHLTQGHRTTEIRKRYRNDLKASRTRSVGDAFVAMWEKVADILHRVADEYDERWRVRKRVLGSLLLMLLIFRLVTSKNSQGYGTTIDDLWDSCDRLNLPMPQEHSVKPAAFCKARKKLDEGIFKRVNSEILAQAPHRSEHRWMGHRLFAVDGSKLNLPRDLREYGYPTPSETSHYPQGLLSCLYELKSQLPFDFDLVSHGNERTCAEQHLRTLQKGDVVVYDRGYYSYLMLHQHHTTGVHAVFRLQQSSGRVIQDFFDGPEADGLVTIHPSATTKTDIRKDHPDFDFLPLPMRLLKYEVGGTTFVLGTTLTEDSQRYPIREFMDAYHGRWGIEELYKVSKRIIDVEDFHAKSERGVKQEVFAHFALITMSRLFATEADGSLNANDTSGSPSPKASSNAPNTTLAKGDLRTNFKNCIHVFARHLEPLLMVRERLAATAAKVFKLVVGRYQRVRSGRSFPRKSMLPDPRWKPSKKNSSKDTAAVATPTPA